MTVADYISRQEESRQPVLTALHEIITASDTKLIAEVAPMMGKEMIQYKKGGFFNYALASVKDHMSLHAMPLYCAASLHEKYEPLLPKAKFQKSCINFKTAEDLPLNIAKQLMKDCAKIDMVAIMQDYQKKKKTSKKA
jgi:hypothetical protein